MRSKPYHVAIKPRLIDSCLALLAAMSPPLFADTLLLTSGEKLVGKVVSQSDSSVTFASTGLGTIEVPRARIQRLESNPEVSAAALLPSTETAPPATNGAAPAVATQPQQAEDVLRMYWDEGLRYELSQPIAVPVPFTAGERVLKEEVYAAGRLGLRASLDAAAFSSANGEPALPSDFDVRTFRLYSSGELGTTGRNRYAIQFGSVSGSFYLHEAYLQHTGAEYVGDITFGYFKVPQTLENMNAFGASTFMESASPSLAFSPGNRMGLQFDRTYSNDRVSTRVGIFSIGANPGLYFGDTTQSWLRPTVRVAGLPIVDQGGVYGRRLLHLGASASYVLARDSEVEYKARPESFLAPYLADTGSIYASKAFIGGLELIYMDGPLTVQSEYVGTRVEGEAENFYFGGYYISASWFVTGEERPYDRAEGLVGLVRPRVDFSWRNKQWGAWELGLRYSRLDLNSGVVRGGDMKVATLGANWYWNRYVRWQFNYEYATVSDGPSPGNLHIFQGRLQVMY